ncbi:hypothetical protein LPJ59_003119 [Coemansia sp. RSA 2399]|nr:hypothetical protein LPJ59_003119 [Coemansia sp. RSA 2399]
MFASKPPSQQQQQQQQPMVPTQPFAGSPQASPISSFVSDHIPFNGGQVPQHQQPPLSRPTPAPVLQDVHQKPWAPVSQEPQRNSRDQPFLAATTIPTNSNNAARTPSPPSLQPGKAPTLPGTYYHPSLQRPPPPRPMAGPPHALQKDSGTNSVPAQPLIGGIEAERILSVVGGAIFSQLALSTAAESEERSAATSTVVEPQHVAPPSSNLREEETNAMPPVVPLAPPPPPPSPPSQSDNNPMAYLPQSLPPPVCNPGSFVCAVHGLDVGYFACDSAGLALPASCAANEVCYQYGQSILCAAPGGAPEVNVLLGHPSF